MTRRSSSSLAAILTDTAAAHGDRVAVKLDDSEQADRHARGRSGAGGAGFGPAIPVVGGAGSGTQTRLPPRTRG